MNNKRRESVTRQNTWPPIIKSDDVVDFTIPSSYVRQSSPKSPSNIRRNAPEKLSDLGTVNPDLYMVEKYDMQISDGIPDGSFASNNENDFPKGHRGRVWFTLGYDSANEKLILSLLKGRNFNKNSVDENSKSEINLSTKIRRKITPSKLLRADSLPAKTSNSTKEVLGVFPSKIKRKAMLLRSFSITKKVEKSTNGPSPVHHTISRGDGSASMNIIKVDKENDDNLFVKIFLLPDTRIQSQAKCKRGLPDPVFAERFVFQVSEESIESKTLQMVFVKAESTGKHVVIGDVTYPIGRGIKHGQTIFEDLQSNPPVVRVHTMLRSYNNLSTFQQPSLFPEAINCELQLSLCYNDQLNRITVVVLRAFMKLGDPLPDLESQVEVKFNVCEKSAKVKTGKLTRQKTHISSTDLANSPSTQRMNGQGHNIEFDFNETYKFPLNEDQKDVTSVTVNIKAKYQNKEMLGLVVVGAFMFARPSGVDHWMEMINKPKEFTKHWHQLILN